MDFANPLPPVPEGTLALPTIRALLAAAGPSMMYAPHIGAVTGLTFAWIGGRRGAITRPHGTQLLAASSTIYMVVDRATGVESFDTDDTDWLDTVNFGRALVLTTSATEIVGWQDWREDPDGGILAVAGGGSVAVVPTCIPIACSDETTALTTGTAKVTFRMPFAMTLTAVRASITTAPTGSTLIVDINEGGSTILSTKLSIDASEKTSTTAASAAVISDASLADDAEITIDVDQVGSSVAGAGLKVYLIGVV